MKRIASLLMMLMLSASAWALAPEIEADRLLLQAKAALDANDYAQASESLAKAEKLGVKLPDSFYYHYGRAYAGAGNLERGRAMLEKYLNISGTKGKFYQEALVEMNKIESAMKKRDADNEAAIKRYNEQLAQYEKNVANCLAKFRSYVDDLENESLAALEKCQRRSYCNPENDSNFVDKRKKFLFVRRDGVEAYCDNRYSKPEKPAFMR